MCSLFYLCRFIETTITDADFGDRLGPLLRHVLWMVYWAAQGCVMTGLWVIGHECGHGGFSDSEIVNDIVGLIVHSYLLVPYFSWKTSHRRHHSNTNNLGRDEVFVPAVESSSSSTYGVNHDTDAGDDHPNPITAIVKSLIRSVNVSHYRDVDTGLAFVFGLQRDVARLWQTVDSSEPFPSHLSYFFK